PLQSLPQRVKAAAVAAPSAPSWGWLDDARALVGKGYGPPLVVLTILDLLMLRNLLLTSGPPASIDSGFTYSLLPFFSDHNTHAFTGWLSWPLGQVQHYSAYWLLAAAQAVIHNPILLYQLAIL